MRTYRLRSCLLPILALAVPNVVSADVTTEEYAVYQALLQQVEWERPKLEGYDVDAYVLRETTRFDDYRPEGTEFVLTGYERSHFPSLEPSAASSFEDRNREGGRLDARHFSGVKIRIMSDREYQVVFSTEPAGLVTFDGRRFRTRLDGWEYFDGKYRRAQGLLTVSRVGFSDDGRQAILYYGNSWAWLAGTGRLVQMEKTEQGWRIQTQLELWVS
jgi:hypothetical protein